MGKTNASISSAFIHAQSGFKDYIRRHKLLLICVMFIVLASVLTGVFTAIKNADNYSSVWFDNYNIVQFYKSNMGTWDLFFDRFISYLICLIIMFLCSLNIFLTPLSFVVLIIRSYLVGLNCCFMFLLFGFGGMITTIIIIFPIQIINLLLMVCFSSTMCVKAKNKKRYGSYCVGNEKKPIVLFLIYLLAFTLVNVLETVLLFVFSSKIILVI